MAARDYGQYGGMPRALELVGERWALLIIRDLLVAGVAERLEAPGAEREHDRLELTTIGGELVDDDA